READRCRNPAGTSGAARGHRQGCGVPGLRQCPMADWREDRSVGWLSVSNAERIEPPAANARRLMRRPCPRRTRPRFLYTTACPRRALCRHEACNIGWMKEYAKGIQSSELSLVDAPKPSDVPKVTDAAPPIVIDYG